MKCTNCGSQKASKIGESSASRGRMTLKMNGIEIVSPGVESTTLIYECDECHKIFSIEGKRTTPKIAADANRR